KTKRGKGNKKPRRSREEEKHIDSVITQITFFEKPLQSGIRYVIFTPNLATFDDTSTAVGPNENCLTKPRPRISVFTTTITWREDTKRRRREVPGM
ncbi:hypothetical protein CEXT_407291, partial [Caerostris extrusa]